MGKNSFSFQMKVAGRERNCRTDCRPLRDSGGIQGRAPGFAYSITEPTGREWLIDKAGAITTLGRAEDHLPEMFAVLKVLQENGAAAVGQVAVTITTEGHNGITLRNLVNILAGKPLGRGANDAKPGRLRLYRSAFGQGYKDISPPTKELMKLVMEKRLAHGGQPVLDWMMDNIYIKTDPAGNIKPDKEKSTGRIDGAVALIMALDRAIRNENTGVVSMMGEGYWYCNMKP
ncbi:hypothetical protein SCACP_24550 [Sporomusa carbonis]